MIKSIFFIFVDVVVEQSGYVSYTQKETSSLLTRFQVQFKTMDSRGILLHAKSSSDFLTLELLQGWLYMLL